MSRLATSLRMHQNINRVDRTADDVVAAMITLRYKTRHEKARKRSERRRRKITHKDHAESCLKKINVLGVWLTTIAHCMLNSFSCFPHMTQRG